MRKKAKKEKWISIYKGIKFLTKDFRPCSVDDRKLLKGFNEETSRIICVLLKDHT